MDLASGVRFAQMNFLMGCDGRERDRSPDLEQGRLLRTEVRQGAHREAVMPRPHPVRKRITIFVPLPGALARMKSGRRGTPAPRAARARARGPSRGASSCSRARTRAAAPPESCRVRCPHRDLDRVALRAGASTSPRSGPARLSSAESAFVIRFSSAHSISSRLSSTSGTGS